MANEKTTDFPDDAVETVEKLAREVTTETLHGPLPLKTSMQLAADVMSACELARSFREERNLLLEMTRKLDEHPDGYDGPCFCRLCCSYGD